MSGDAPVNTGGPLPWPGLLTAEQRVLKIQAKLHQWARNDPHRQFGDLFNLVADPAFLMVAWDRVPWQSRSPVGRGRRGPVLRPRPIRARVLGPVAG